MLRGACSSDASAVLSDTEVQQLQALASSRSLPHSILQRAQIVLACSVGEPNTANAKRMGLTGMTAGKWRKQYRELGLEALHGWLRPGRPRSYEDDSVAGVINRALQTRSLLRISSPPMGVPGAVHAHSLLTLASP